MKRRDIFTSRIPEKEPEAQDIDSYEQTTSIVRLNLSSFKNKQKTPTKSMAKILTIPFAFILIFIITIQYQQYQVNVDKVEQQLNKEKQQLTMYKLKEKSSREELKHLKEQIEKEQIQIQKQIAIDNNNNQAQDQIQIDKNQQFQVPKIVWLYLPRDIKQENYITQLGFENIKHYATTSHFQFRVVTSSTYKDWFNEPILKQIQDFLDKVKKNSLVAPAIDSITKKLVELYLMRLHGGVIIDYKLIFVEKLDWIRSIHKNVMINRGNKIQKPKYFAFHNMYAGPQWTPKEREVDYQAEKPVYVYPGLTENFLVGVADGQFIKEVIKVYTSLIQTDITGRNQIINNNRIEKGQLDANNHNHLYSLAAHVVIRRKQIQLDNKQTGKYYKFAIDQYGLVTMNEHYATQKMWVLFKNRLNTRNYFDSFYNYLAKLPQRQFEEVIGPIRFVSNPDPYYQFDKRLERAKNGQTFEVWEGSYIHKQLYQGQKLDFIKPNPEISKIATTYKKWQSLPKKLWLFWDKGLDNALAGNQLCAQNIIKNAKLANFEVFKVDDTNLKDFLPESEINKIEQTIRQAKFPLQAQIRSDFIRLALLYAHGGIYMDASYIWFESFDWFIDVAKEPSHLIFNRFGQHPKVMMQFHSLEGSPFDWTIDTQYNTKSTWHLAYENNLIIAEKENQFIKEWYDLFIKFTVSSFQQTEQKMIQCGTNDMRWTQPHDRYLTSMDSLKAVLGCRQKLVEKDPGSIKNAADYYKIWTFNGFTGLQKFRYYNDYTFAYGGAINNDPEALYRLSIEFNNATIGTVYKGIKLYSWNIRFLNSYLERFYRGNFEKQSHPKSYFHKYLFSKEEHQFYATDKLHVRVRKH